MLEKSKPLIFLMNFGKSNNQQKKLVQVYQTHLMRLISTLMFLPWTVTCLYGIDIQAQHWKLSLPMASSKGNSKEIMSDTLKTYLQKPTSIPKNIIPYFHISQEGLVFHCVYTGVTTSSRTKYSRSEFREIKSGQEHNWPIDAEPSLSCRLKISDLAPKTNKLIFMQIHGHAPSSKPLIKCIWEKGKIKILSKSGKDLKDFKKKETYEKIAADTWFNCRIIVRNKGISIFINDQMVEFFSQEEVLSYWPKENTYYFKAGNYLQHTHQNAAASVVFSEINLTR